MTRKVEWQRRTRDAFKEQNGYSQTCHYGAGRLRKAVLERDGYACVQCGMTDIAHKDKWNRPITIDHKDRDRTRNTMDNLQTLCLSCHGRKDLIPQLRVAKIPEHQEIIVKRRAEGATYQQIADELDVSIASVWKWVKRWEGL